jgi:hypothetical protein
MSLTRVAAPEAPVMPSTGQPSRPRAERLEPLRHPDLVALAIAVARRRLDERLEALAD